MLQGNHRELRVSVFLTSQFHKTYDKEYNSVNSSDRRRQADQDQRGVRKPRHEDGDRNPDAESGGNPLDHHGDASAPAIEITDAAEQYAG